MGTWQRKLLDEIETGSCSKPLAKGMLVKLCACRLNSEENRVS